MTFSLTDKTFGLHVKAASKPFAATYAALSAFDPAQYSLPEPPSSGPDAKAPPSTAALAVTSLPGCAARPSMDFSDGKAQRRVDNLLCCQPDLLPGRDTVLGPAGAPQPQLPQPPRSAVINPAAQRQQHLKAQPAPDPQQELERQLERQMQANARRRLLHYDRDANRARRNYRPSIDAAAGAAMLNTCPAPDLPSTQPAGASAGLGPGTHLTEADEMPGCVPSPAPVPFAAVMPPSPQRRWPAAAGQSTEWDFGENAQRARLLARYAAMAAAEEMRYDPAPGAGGGGSDSEGEGDGKASRRSRGAWKLISALLGSSKAVGGKSAATPTAAVAAVVQRWQEATATSKGGAGQKQKPGGGRGGGGGGGAGGTRSRRGSMADEDASVHAVVRSRDSRRLLRVHRSRVGIDQVAQKPPGRASAPAYSTDPSGQPQQQQHLEHMRQLQSRNSAPAASMMSWVGGSEAEEGDVHDEVTAAVMAAAAEVSAAEAAVVRSA